ncbi:hypothetical protein Terro_3158 [Terriglobus roseus DSM 18391]|uniref:Uncharacterized protein n=1 Tax=Terriglobus roseus (strain DSM 18391 / NRRL B-41598 / KBS 63) TaxID=926566 RepID=I3ZJG6_TERRK|nr:hypothetical protein Terro_3158 [Terriglobus roseus DSM 18391]
MITSSRARSAQPCYPGHHLALSMASSAAGPDSFSVGDGPRGQFFLQLK